MKKTYNISLFIFWLILILIGFFVENHDEKVECYLMVIVGLLIDILWALVNYKIQTNGTINIRVVDRTNEVNDTTERRDG